MPHFLITITYLNPTLKTVSGIREGISLKHTHDVYLEKARKFYHDLVSFDIVEVEKPKYTLTTRPKSTRKKDGGGNWSVNVVGEAVDIPSRYVPRDGRRGSMEDRFV